MRMKHRAKLKNLAILIKINLKLMSIEYFGARCKRLFIVYFFLILVNYNGK